ncbi:MAG: hypothetical protein QOH13_981 [Thermoleophilaceae bacterium]|nr:hypothetical protein [Thermoleophilaceae bacterium]
MLSAGDEPAALRSLNALLRDLGLEGCYSVLDAGGSPVAGLARDELLEKTRKARFLLNVMGFVVDPEVLAAARRRVFLDIDPGFGQVWRELGLADVFAGHDDFVTVGRNVGAADCGVPTCGLRWLTISPPVALDHCPAVDGGADFTSVGSWRGPYDRIEYEGKSLGLRAHEFRKFFDLPRRVDARFRLALEIDPSDTADLDQLRAAGWQLVDPRDVAADPAAYMGFVQGSCAEFTVAKGIYTELRTGWIGDRSACYLASAKPALVQDTGLAGHYPLGEGLLAFSTLEEAAAGAEEILRDYPRHAKASRRIAETHFDARIVLGRLIEELG